MSVWNYLFDSDWRQRSDIEALRNHQIQTRQIERRRRQKTLRQEERIEELEGEIGELSLFCRTAVSLLVEKGLVTQAEFQARAQALDASDGTVDGRFKQAQPGSSGERRE